MSRLIHMAFVLTVAACAAARTTESFASDENSNADVARAYVVEKSRRLPLVLDEKSFGPFVRSATRPVVVLFGATWCGPCRKVTPIFDALAKDYGEVHFVKIDVDKSPSIARKYKIRPIPTFVFFNEGRVVRLSIGYVPKPTLAKWIEAEFPWPRGP